MPSPIRASVVMCTYNGARHVGRQLQSFADQSLRPHELVVSDDASTDDTVAVVRAFAARADFPVRVHVNATNQGLHKNFSLGFALATGDVILPSDQDDHWLPDKVRTLVAAFDEFPGAEPLGLAFCDATVVDDEMRPTGTTHWARVGFGPAHRRAIAADRAFQTILRFNLIAGATMAFRANLRPLLLPIPEGCPYDSWIPLVTAAVAPCAAIDAPLNLYRQHVGQSVGLENLKMPRRVSIARQQGVAELDAQSAILRTLLARLPTGGTRPNAARSHVESKLDFLNARRRVHTLSRVRRLPLLVRQAAFGRYHRYASGWKSVAKDTLF